MMRHDFYGYHKKYVTLFTNYCIIYPAIFAFAFGYLMPNIYFGSNPMNATILLAGHAVINILVLAYATNMMLLFDLDGDRYIDYQITLLNPRIVLLQRMLFASLFSALAAMPFFPIIKLMLRDGFVTHNTSWLALFGIIYIGSILCSAYTIFLACYIENPRSLVRFWLRVNFLLITLGGLFAPWHIMYTFSPVLGYIVLLNPLLYLTEGIRHAITQSPQFIPAHLCIVALLAYSIVFMLFAWYYFKKRMDHI